MIKKVLKKKKAGREEERWYGGRIAVNIAKSCCSCHRPNFSLISKARAGNIKQKVNQLMSTSVVKYLKQICIAVTLWVVTLCDLCTLKTRRSSRINAAEKAIVVFSQSFQIGAQSCPYDQFPMCYDQKSSMILARKNLP
jgi:hypothetical protein